MGRAGRSSGSGGSRSSGGSGGSRSRSSFSSYSSSSSYDSGSSFSDSDYSMVDIDNIDMDWVKSIQCKLIVVIFLVACIIPGLFIFINAELVLGAFMIAIAIWVVSFILLTKSYMKNKKNNDPKEDK